MLWLLRAVIDLDQQGKLDGPDGHKIGDDTIVPDSIDFVVEPKDLECYRTVESQFATCRQQPQVGSDHFPLVYVFEVDEETFGDFQDFLMRLERARFLCGGKLDVVKLPTARRKARDDWKRKDGPEWGALMPHIFEELMIREPKWTAEHYYDLIL